MKITVIKTTNTPDLREGLNLTAMMEGLKEGAERIRKAHIEDEYAGWGYNYYDKDADNAMVQLRASLGLSR